MTKMEGLNTSFGPGYETVGGRCYSCDKYDLVADSPTVRALADNQIRNREGLAG